MLQKVALKFLSWSYDATINGGGVGAHTEPGLIFSPRTFVFLVTGIVDVGFTGAAGGAYGIGIVGSPNLFFTSDFTLLPTGTMIDLNGSYLPNGGVVTNDIINQTAVTGKITISLFYIQFP